LKIKLKKLYFEKCPSFLEKKHLKPVGVRSLTAAIKLFFFLPKNATIRLLGVGFLCPRTISEK
jgi:hypothetical protein